MRYLFLCVLITLTVFCSAQESFKTDQLRYSRVRAAYAEKKESMEALLKSAAIDDRSFHVYIRAFKEEGEIELWIRGNDEKKYKLLKTYAVCESSGNLGPKREQGDYQVPEGFYRIDRFNPFSNFHLSLGINYPNRSDHVLGTKGRLGGDIFIHGNCVTIGCLPITDDQIKELYIICVEAKRMGQKSIPVTLFPSKLTDSKFESLKKEYKEDSDKIGLWTDLKLGFDLFNETKQLPSIGFLNNGRHQVR